MSLLPLLEEITSTIKGHIMACHALRTSWSYLHRMYSDRDMWGHMSLMRGEVYLYHLCSYWNQLLILLVGLSQQNNIVDHHSLGGHQQLDMWGHMSLIRGRISISTTWCVPNGTSCWFCLLVSASKAILWTAAHLGVTSSSLNALIW